MSLCLSQLESRLASRGFPVKVTIGDVDQHGHKDPGDCLQTIGYVFLQKQTIQIGPIVLVSFRNGHYEMNLKVA